KRERKKSKEGGQSRSKKERLSESKIERLSESKIERLSESKKGVQSESQKGVQSESKKGVQSESQKGVQREPEKGELSEPQKGVLSESKKGVQSQSKKGVQSESKKRVQSKSKKGLQIKRQTFRRNTVPPVFFADVSPSSSSSDDSKPNSESSSTRSKLTGGCECLLGTRMENITVSQLAHDAPESAKVLLVDKVCDLHLFSPALCTGCWQQCFDLASNTVCAKCSRYERTDLNPAKRPRKESIFIDLDLDSRLYGLLVSDHTVK
ncbi:hypothetical protein BaRGS_00037914, partial [Batillaria attramentaria]